MGIFSYCQKNNNFVYIRSCGYISSNSKVTSTEVQKKNKKKELSKCLTYKKKRMKEEHADKSLLILMPVKTKL